MGRKRKNEVENGGDQNGREEDEGLEPKRLKAAEVPSVSTTQAGMPKAEASGADGVRDVAGQQDGPVWCLKKAQEEKPSRHCPYLDTIDRGVLDFDFEKLCSVSLSRVNIYACLVCGKYFQGRGTNTHAYTHALDTDHHVYLNLSTLKFYCLPDNYEVIDPSLEDIIYVLKPSYTPEYIRNLDRNVKLVRAFDGSNYHPGLMGLNNIKANDYTNVVFHALSAVPPLRDYFLREENYASIKRPPGDKLVLLSQRFGELIRKLWNPRAFKAHVSPHEMLQAVVLCSDKKFQIIKQGDAYEFMTFFLNTLHLALNGTTKTPSSVIYKTFRGRMRQYTRRILPIDTSEEAKKTLMETVEFTEKMSETPFLSLAMDLPPAPLYRDALLQNIIPQVPLGHLLTKFNGKTEKEYNTYKENFTKRFELTQLPEYLIVTYNRFNKNQWFIEKNPTIVNFSIRCVHFATLEPQYAAMKKESFSNVDLYDCLAEDAKGTIKYTTYDLIANVVHDGKPQSVAHKGDLAVESSTYRVQVLQQGAGKWFELEDLHVKEILPQTITLAESYIQIWRLDTKRTRTERMGESDEVSATLTKAEPIAE